MHKPTSTSYAPAGVSDPQFVLFETEAGVLYQREGRRVEVELIERPAFSR